MLNKVHFRESVLPGNALTVCIDVSAPQLKLSDDRLSVTGEKGYCMLRATHGMLYSYY